MRARLAHSSEPMLVLAVGLLYACGFEGQADVWRAALFLAHLGVVLLWQPLVPGDRRLSWRGVAALGGTALLLAVCFNAWILLAWTALVIALVGGWGGAGAPRAQRWLQAGLLAFLTAFLFTSVLPALLPAELRDRSIAPEVRQGTRLALGGILVVLLLPAVRLSRLARTSPLELRAFDPLRAGFLLLLVLLISFFGVALMTLASLGYLEAIATTLVAVAALLAVADVLAGPGPARDGAAMRLPLFLSRYLLSAGVPYESWLERLAALSRDEPDATRFFDASMRTLAEVFGIVYMRWSGAMPPGGFGELAAGHRLAWTTPLSSDGGSVAIEIRTRDRANVSLAWHLRILVQLALEFHSGKAREEGLRSRQYLHAVHETGARVTHDVKNLLQSLESLIGAAGVLEDDAQVRALVRRQLPAISLRLGQTLSKLARPAGDSGPGLEAGAWWQKLAEIYGSQGVEFTREEDGAPCQLPEALFDTVADNLLQNALQKRRGEPGIRVRAKLRTVAGEAAITVEDNGGAVPGEVAARLMSGPVNSRSGLGIGLYQSADQARAAGWELELAENRAGCVRFELRRAAPRPGGTP